MSCFGGTTSKYKKGKDPNDKHLSASPTPSQAEKSSGSLESPRGSSEVVKAADPKQTAPSKPIAEPVIKETAPKPAAEPQATQPQTQSAAPKPDAEKQVPPPATTPTVETIAATEKAPAKQEANKPDASNSSDAASTSSQDEGSRRTSKEIQPEVKKEKDKDKETDAERRERRSKRRSDSDKPSRKRDEGLSTDPEKRKGSSKSDSERTERKRPSERRSKDDSSLPRRISRELSGTLTRQKLQSRQMYLDMSPTSSRENSPGPSPRASSTDTASSSGSPKESPRSPKGSLRQSKEAIAFGDLASHLEMHSDDSSEKRTLSPRQDDKPVDVEKAPPVNPNNNRAPRRLQRFNSVASANPMYYRQTPVSEAASQPSTKVAPPPTDRVIESVPYPEAGLLDYVHLFSGGKPNINLLKEHLLKEGRLDDYAAYALIEQAGAIFRKEPNLLELEPPYAVCGDIHGQFYDLVNLFDQAGSPGTTNFLFLGDYVDRGSFSCEVCFLMFACKINFPTTFNMLRGNHESRGMTDYYNFKLECITKYSEKMYEAFMECFDGLPVAATMACRQVGKFFCVHGGLSPELATLEDIRKMNRFQEPPEAGPLCDLLWSDPIMEDDLNTAIERAAFFHIEFTENSMRGIGHMFGWKAVKQFLDRNNIVSIIRAHEVQEQGFKEHTYLQTNRQIPAVYTVFSAPNYCDMYANRGAFMLFSHDEFQIKQFDDVPHPYWLPDFQNAFSFSVNFMADQVRSLVTGLAKHCDKNGVDDWTPDAIASAFAHFSFPDEIAKFQVLTNMSQYERFKEAVSMDLLNEKRAPTKGGAKNNLLKRFHSSHF